MPPTELQSALRNFIRQRFNVPDADSDFSDEVHLFDYGYVDSFGAVDLIAFVEQQGGVKIQESDLVLFPLNTIHEITTFVTQRTQGEI